MMNNIKTIKRLGRAEQYLIDMGISKCDAPEVVRNLGYILFGRDIYSGVLDDRQSICNALCDALILTSNAGDSRCNALEELLYIPEKESVRPIFEDGSGSDGYYDICVAGDSGTAVITDIVRQFIVRMW